MMERKHETGMAVIAAVVLLVLILLSSCRTKSEAVTELVTVHDTVWRHRTDTVRDVRQAWRTDTVRQAEWHAVTLGPSGDTIREVHRYRDRKLTRVVDSTYRYRAERDSLRAALAEERLRDKTVVVRQSIPPWLQWSLLSSCVLGVFAVVLRGRGRG